MAKKVKEFCGIKTDPAFFILDLPNQHKFVHDSTGKHTEAEFRTFVQGFLSETLPKKGIKE